MPGNGSGRSVWTTFGVALPGDRHCSDAKVFADPALRARASRIALPRGSRLHPGVRRGIAVVGQALLRPALLANGRRNPTTRPRVAQPPGNIGAACPAEPEVHVANEDQSATKAAASRVPSTTGATRQAGAAGATRTRACSAVGRQHRRQHRGAVLVPEIERNGVVDRRLPREGDLHRVRRRYSRPSCPPAATSRTQPQLPVGQADGGP